MQVNISVRRGSLSEASQAKIRAKVEKLVRFNDRLTSADVTVDLEDKEAVRVDVNVSAGNKHDFKHDFVATDRSESLLGAVDGVCHKLEQQLRKYKDKVQSRYRQPGRGETALPGSSEQ